MSLGFASPSAALSPGSETTREMPSEFDGLPRMRMTTGALMEGVRLREVEIRPRSKLKKGREG